MFKVFPQDGPPERFSRLQEASESSPAASRTSQDASQRPENAFKKSPKHSRRAIQMAPRASLMSSSDLEELSRMSKSLVSKHPLRTSRGQAAVGVARKSGPALLARKPFESEAVHYSALHLHLQFCNAICICNAFCICILQCNLHSAFCICFASAFCIFICKASALRDMET